MLNCLVLLINHLIPGKEFQFASRNDNHNNGEGYCLRLRVTLEVSVSTENLKKFDPPPPSDVFLILFNVFQAFHLLVGFMNALNYYCKGSKKSDLIFFVNGFITNHFKYFCFGLEIL